MYTFVVTAPGIHGGKRAVVYLRVSTDEQGASIEAQREMCARLARQVVAASLLGARIKPSAAQSHSTNVPSLKRALRALADDRAHRPQIGPSACYMIPTILLAEQESRPGLAPRDPGTPKHHASFHSSELGDHCETDSLPRISVLFASADSGAKAVTGTSWAATRVRPRYRASPQL